MKASVDSIQIYIINHIIRQSEKYINGVLALQTLDVAQVLDGVGNLCDRQGVVRRKTRVCDWRVLYWRFRERYDDTMIIYYIECLTV